MLVKIHNSYRRIVAICDSDLLGKKFEENNKELNMKPSFFEGDEKNEKEVFEIIEREAAEDATFNIVGKESVEAALEAGIIDKQGIMKIDNIPIARGLM